MPAPSTTLNQVVIAAGAHAAGASRTGDLNLLDKWQATVQVEIQFGGAMNADPTVNVYAAVDSATTPTFDTEPVLAFEVPRAANATRRLSVRLPTGLWRLEIKNNDGANALVSSRALAAVVTQVA